MALSSHQSVSGHDRELFLDAIIDFKNVSNAALLFVSTHPPTDHTKANKNEASIAIIGGLRNRDVMPNSVPSSDISVACASYLFFSELLTYPVIKSFSVASNMRVSDAVRFPSPAGEIFFNSLTFSTDAGRYVSNNIDKRACASSPYILRASDTQDLNCGFHPTSAGSI